MILMIDNYDSFTYNLVQYLGELGEELIVRRNDEITIEQIEELGPDFLMISRGPSHLCGRCASRSRFSEALAAWRNRCSGLGPVRHSASR